MEPKYVHVIRILHVLNGDVNLKTENPKRKHVSWMPHFNTNTIVYALTNTMAPIAPVSTLASAARSRTPHHNLVLLYANINSINLNRCHNVMKPNKIYEIAQK